MDQMFKVWTIFAVVVFTAACVVFAPSFMRAQKRSRATKIVNDARIYEAAIDQWAIENNQVNSSTFQYSNVSDYIRADLKKPTTTGIDILAQAPKDPAESGQLSDVKREDFWKAYAPKAAEVSATPAQP